MCQCGLSASDRWTVKGSTTMGILQLCIKTDVACVQHMHLQLYIYIIYIYILYELNVILYKRYMQYAGTYCIDIICQVRCCKYNSIHDLDPQRSPSQIGAGF